MFTYLYTKLQAYVPEQKYRPCNTVMQFIIKSLKTISEPHELKTERLVVRNFKNPYITVA